jgi:serine/threonine protein kinase
VGATGFLDGPVPEALGTVDESARERPGTVIGPYKLLEQIGEGGFGIVFIAEQQQPVRRKVALKVLKPGMDTRHVVARFEAERQALALMDHPHIALVFDGGETASGRPYFVMELVKGVPITRFCDDKHLPVRERLELFVSVCQAVQHAHQKGIIHRDLKPSNVLVTLHDDRPVVKVIDFGIAKATAQQLTEKTLYTGFAQMVGTPLYMSPEQAGMSGLDVDTRSDIYSLGVLLYELLTGTTPFDKKRLGQVGHDELRRIIREEEPPKPSTRISTLGQGGTTVSTQRKSDPKRLSQLFRGELDWVVMKALEKDRNRRYESASAFAADVQRYLHDEPVQACPPSAWYRFRKFARRKRGIFVSAAALALIVLLTMVGLTVGFVKVKQEKDAKETAFREKDKALKQNKKVLKEKEKALKEVQQEKNAKEAALKENKKVLKEKEKALKEATKQNNIAKFHLGLAQVAVHDCLTNVAQNSRLRAAGFHDLRRALLRPSVNILKALALNYKSDPKLQDYLADVYSDLALLLQEIGEQQQALEYYQRMRGVVARLARLFPNKLKYRLDLARAHHDAATILCELGRRSEAEPLYKKALALRKKVIQQGNNAPGNQHNLMLTHICLGLLCTELGRLREALAYYDEAMTLQQQLVKQFPKVADYRDGLAMTFTNRANLFLEMNQVPRSAAACQEAIAIQEKLAAEFSDRPDYRQQLATSYNNLANVKGVLGKREQALAALAKAISIQERLAADFPRVPAYRLDLARSQNNRGRLLRLQGKPAEALASFRQALAIYEDLVKRFPKVLGYADELAVCYNNMGYLVLQGRPDAALPWFTRAITTLEPVLAQEPKLLRARSSFFRAHWARATARNLLGRHSEALHDYDKAIEFADGRVRPILRVERAMTLARLKEFARATAEADAVAGARDANAAVVYDAACVFAVCAGFAQEAGQADRQADRAVALLKRAVARGFKDVAHLKKDKALAALRARNDFRDLLKELEQKKKE